MAAQIVDNVITLNGAGDNTGQILGTGSRLDATLLIKGATGVVTLQNDAGATLMAPLVIGTETLVIPRAKYTGGIKWVTANSVIYVILH